MSKKLSLEDRAALLSILPDIGEKASRRTDGAESIIVSGQTGGAFDLTTPNQQTDLPYFPCPEVGDTGEVQYLSAQDEMQMACEWFCSLSEEDAAQVLPIFRTIREGYRSESEAPKSLIVLP